MLAGCGSRSGLLLDSTGSSTTGAGGATTTAPACSLHLEHRPLPAFAPGGLCTAGPGALPGSTMAAIRERALDGFTPGGAALQHAFFPDAAPPAWYEAAHAVTARGEWVFAGDVVAKPQDQSPGQAMAEVIIADRQGKVLATRSLSAGYSNGFTQLRMTGNDGGLVACSFESYPASHTLEIMAPSGEVLASAKDVDPLTDPDDAGLVAVRETEAPEVRTFWLSACSGELRETLESQRPVRTTPVPWGRFLVYTDPDTATLVVEGSEGATHLDLGEPKGAQYAAIFDFHPSGWALVTTQDPLRFTAIHAGTGERHTLSIELPQGYARYASYTGALGPGQFDSNSRELRVTSQGGLILPLRSASLGYLFTSPDGKSWEPVGEPIGQVYGAVGVEAGGSFVHIGNAYALMLPAWDPAPPGTPRLDYQSVQLVRPSAGKTTVVEQSPMGQFYNDVFRLSADGGCLERSPIGGSGAAWYNALTGEAFSFPPPGPQTSDLTPAVQWATPGDVEIFSLL